MKKLIEVEGARPAAYPMMFAAGMTVLGRKRNEHIQQHQH